MTKLQQKEDDNHITTRQKEISISVRNMQVHIDWDFLSYISVAGEGWMDHDFNLDEIRERDLRDACIAVVQSTLRLEELLKRYRELYNGTL